MSASNQRDRQAGTDGSAVDWAERLKASMDTGTDPHDAPASTISEDDDLAALLRAQLQRSTDDHTVTPLDTSEFEEEADEEPEEILDEEPEEEPEEFFDEEPEEKPEEILDEEPEEESEEILDEEPEEEPEEILDEEPEEEPEEIFDEELEEESEEPPAPFVPLAAITDGELNSGCVDEPIGGRHLQALDEQNTDLLRQHGRLGTADSGEPLDLFEQAKRAESLMRHEDDRYAPSTADVRPASTSAPSPSASSRVSRPDPLTTYLKPFPLTRDPLQTGFDDRAAYVSYEDEYEEEPDIDDEPDDFADCLSILDAEMPVGGRTRPTAPTPRPQPAPTADYTRRMAREEEEAEKSDTDLYLRLGYEDHLRHADEQDRVERLRAEQRREAPVTPRNETTVVADGREYAGRGQTDAIETAYIRARRQGIARICLSALGALVALLYDIFLPLSKDVDIEDFVASDWYAPLGLCWMLLILVPFVPRILRGLRSLVDTEPVRYAVSSLAVAVTLIHGIIACFVTTDVPLSLYNGIALFMLTVAAVAEYVVTVGEHRAFVVASSGKPTSLLTNETTPASAVMGAENSRVAPLTAVRAGRISDYFARTAAYNPYMARLNYFLPVALFVAIVCCFVNAILGGDPLADGLRGFTATFLACLPATYILSMTLPLYLANNAIASRGAAVVGTATPTDYIRRKVKGPTEKTVVFRDGDALVASNRKEITLRDDPHIDEHRRLAAAVFEAIASPMADRSPVQDISTDGIRAEIAERGDQYVKLTLIDDRSRAATEVMLGTHAALIRRGIRLPKVSMERVYRKTENSRVLYLAFDGHFAMAYAAEYRATRLFSLTVAELAQMGYSVAVMTYDPLVTPDLFETESTVKHPITLLQPDYLETARASRSGGLIATGQSTDLLYPLVVCHQMDESYRSGHLAAWLTLAVGSILSILSAFFLESSIALSTGILLIWQILALVPPILLAYLPRRHSTLLQTTGQRPSKTGNRSRNDANVRRDEKIAQPPEADERTRTAETTPRN